MAVYPITPVPDGTTVRELNTYDVMVYTENGHYYARDSRRNLICVDSPTACVQESINYLYQYGGGRILIKSGIYYPTETVNIPDGIKLIIEGEGDTTIFRYTNSFTLFLHNPTNPTWTSILKFSNFKVDRSGSTANNANIIYVLYAFYDEYDNIIIVDDYRNTTEDVGLYGRNSIVSNVHNCKFFNKASPVWFHSYLVNIYDNYANNSALTGFAAGQILPESVYGYLQPPGYPLDGLVVIENNTCIDCGRADEAYAVDNESNNPYTYGTGIIRNNMLITQNYSVYKPFVCGYVDRCIIENNTLIGNVLYDLLEDVFYQTRPQLLVVKNNYINATLASGSSTQPLILMAGKLIIENNIFYINANVQQNITQPIAMQYANYVIFRNNYFKLTLPSGYSSVYGIDIEDQGSGSKDLELVAVENNNINISAGMPLTVSMWGTYQTPPLVKITGNRLYSGSSTNILIGLRANNTTKAIVLDNELGGGISGLSLYADSGLNPVLIFLERDMSIVSASSNITISYAKRNNGIATFSGNGSTTQFTIPHNLISAPSKVFVTPGSANANGSFYVTADSTNIYVNYVTAPPSGTNNIVLYWYAEV